MFMFSGLKSILSNHQYVRSPDNEDRRQDSHQGTQTNGLSKTELFVTQWLLGHSLGYKTSLLKYLYVCVCVCMTQVFQKQHGSCTLAYSIIF